MMKSNLKKEKKIVLIAAALIVAVLVPVLWSAARSGHSYYGNDANDDGSYDTFMSYAGPVLPMTVLEDAPVTAERTVTFQYESDKVDPDSEAWFRKRPGELKVLDSYLLHNPTDNEVSFRVLYPFLHESLTDVILEMPTLAIDGNAADSHMMFAASGGSDTLYQTGRYSFQDVKPVLEDASRYDYLIGEDGSVSETLSAQLDEVFSQTVWRFTVGDITLADPEEDVTSIEVVMRIPTETLSGQTRYLTYGFHFGWPEADGMHQTGFDLFRDAEGELVKGLHQVIFFGEDPGMPEFGAYHGYAEEAVREEGAVIDVVKEELTLREALGPMMEVSYDHYLEGAASMETADYVVSKEVYTLLWESEMMMRGVMTPDNVPEFPMLEEFHLDDGKLLYYQSATVTIPPKGTVQIDAKMTKWASFDYKSSRGGYTHELATKAGTNLAIDKQEAVLEGAEQIRIFRQNFGFDPAHGVTRVALSPEEELYYLEVEYR